MRKPPDCKEGEINWDFYDRFTVTHVIVGMLYATVGLSFLTALLLGIFWELIENTLKVHLHQLFPRSTGDTWKNRVGDIIAVCLGWYIFQLA